MTTKHIKCIHTHTHDNQVAIAREGGIKPLVELARDGTPMQKEEAAAALCSLVNNNADNQVAITHAGWQL